MSDSDESSPQSASSAEGSVDAPPPAKRPSRRSSRKKSPAREADPNAGADLVYSSDADDGAPFDPGGAGEAGREDADKTARDDTGKAGKKGSSSDGEGGSKARHSRRGENTPAGGGSAPLNAGDEEGSGDSGSFNPNMNKGSFKKQNFQKGQNPNANRNFNKKKKFKDKKKRRGGGGGGGNQRWEDTADIELGQLPGDEQVNDLDALARAFEERFDSDAEPLAFLDYYCKPVPELREAVEAAGCTFEQAPGRQQMMDALVGRAAEERRPIRITGVLDLPDEDDEYGILCYEADNYRLKALSAFVAPALIRKYGLERGHILEVDVAPHRENESCPYVLRLHTVMGRDPESVGSVEPFTELVPYYPTERILLETAAGTDVKITWDNTSMRVVDCVSPVGFGQRGLIVAPPRTGKTVLLQGMAHAVQNNYPEAHLIVLLVDERPEEVTDFKRQVSGEVISSTFDENAESHVHAAEMVIEKARRMVECGRDVVILLDSITRLARAYNTTMPNSGKILSGGVEANALQKPKRFFGSARNIEEGGSLTIIATALVETGSKMDEVIFEEFKGTGNMELHLDRELINKRIFPALDFDKSGTRKEELLYHPDEMQKIHSLRRAMKGVPGPEAMEMLIQRIRKSKSNAEFLVSLSR